MKNNIKKIIVGILSFAMLLGAQSVFASVVTWNTASNDCKGLSIINATTLQGYQNPCWPNTSVSANGGETIGIRIYYHNTGTVTATNAHVMLIPSSSIGSSSTSKVFTGRIVSDQGSVSFSQPVTANLTSSQSLTLSSVKWYTNNTSETLTPLLSSQSSIMTDGGLPIGDITAGWASQGSVVIAFKISNNSAPAPACVINSFTASPTSITNGNSSTLSWSTSNCTTVSINPNIGSTVLSGSQVVYPTSTKTYTLTAYSASGASQIRNVTINVTQAPQVCQDTSATNYGGALPCTYPAQVCRDTTATNYGGALPCTYPQVCRDTTATNYGGALPCTYPAQVCRDTTASNYGGPLPCTYPQICRDVTATNYGGPLPCTYPSHICQDHNATNYGGPLPCTYPPQTVCTINSFNASPSSITSGGMSTLTWNTSDCTNVTISNLGYNVPLSGVQAVYPTVTTNYVLSAYGATGGTQTRSATVYVNQIPQTCQDPNATNYGGILPCQYPQSVCSINNFGASDTNISEGESSALNWSTSNCNNVTISNLGYNVPLSGVQTVFPASTRTYTLTAYGATGGTQTRNVTIYVDQNNNNNCDITDFTASDTNIEEGDSTTLRWNTNNCDNVRISNLGNVNESGSRTVYPSDDTTYVLTASNTDGTTESRYVRIYVDNNNNNDNNCSINSFTSNNIYVNSGDAVTLRWSTSYCNNVTISNLNSNLSYSGSQVVYPTTTTTYNLRAYGNRGSDSRSITINVNYTPAPPIIYNSNVVTTVATNISQTGAQLNGLITNTTYNNANVHFEYGTTVGLGLSTGARSVNGNTNFSDFVSNLSPNTIYFFQAVSDGSNGTSHGAIEVFKTLGYGTVTPVKKVIVQGPTVTASVSPIVLRIEDRYQSIGIGDIVDYTVYYKNISLSTLRNPMVQVFIPKGITLLNTSAGTYSENEKTLSVPIRDLAPNDEGYIYLQGRVDSMDANLAQVVTTAILVYTNPNGAQENAMAYVLNNPKINTNVLGASAIFGNIFGMSLIGWLIIIILIMILVLLARSLASRNAGNITIHN